MQAMCHGPHLSQVSLQTVLGIRHFRDAVGEGYVNVIELIPQLVGGGVKQHLGLITELV